MCKKKGAKTVFGSTGVRVRLSQEDIQRINWSPPRLETCVMYYGADMNKAFVRVKPGPFFNTDT